MLKSFKYMAYGPGKHPIYDIVKALGIIAVVLGHCCPIRNVILFVYGYHLALFFFISGTTYNEEKYALKPFDFLSARVKKLWPGYFLYMTAFTLIHNIAVRTQLHSWDNMYTLGNICKRIWNNFLLSGSELFGGALWYVPALLVSLLAFSAIVYFSTRYGRKYPVIFIVGLCVLGGYAGIIFNLSKTHLTWHSHTSLLALPIICAGYLFRHYKLYEKHIFRWYIAVPCFVFFYYFIIIKVYRIELSAEMIGSKYLFYPISLAGIYFIFYIASLIGKVPVLKNVFAFIGQHSFDIMAMHFLVIKAIDVIYGQLTNQLPSTIPVFPKAYGQLWPVYLIASLTVPPVLRIGVDKIWTKFNSLICPRDTV